MAGTIVVFDFDKTIIDCDSDNWVIDQLGGTARFDELLLTNPWNTAMDMIMGEFHAQGRTAEEIVEALNTAPLHRSTIGAIKSAYNLGCDLRVVSDANRFFIETILKHHGLIEFFSEINTNPGFVDEEGRLRILPFHDFKTSSHGCSVGTCPPNMCKSKIIDRIQASAFAQGMKRIIYLGDGKGDFCPSLSLTEGDYMMPRKGYPVWELICSNRHLLKAEIHEWTDFEDQARILLQIINKFINADRNMAAQLMDYKFQTSPVASHEALSKALKVRH